MRLFQEKGIEFDFQGQLEDGYSEVSILSYALLHIAYYLLGESGVEKRERWFRYKHRVRVMETELRKRVGGIDLLEGIDLLGVEMIGDSIKIPFTMNDKKMTAFIAGKNSPDAKQLPGFELSGMSDLYVIKIVSQDDTEESSEYDPEDFYRGLIYEENTMSVPSLEGNQAAQLIYHFLKSGIDDLVNFEYDDFLTRTFHVIYGLTHEDPSQRGIITSAA